MCSHSGSKIRLSCPYTPQLGHECFLITNSFLQLGHSKYDVTVLVHIPDELLQLEFIYQHTVALESLLRHGHGQDYCGIVFTRNGMEHCVGLGGDPC